MTYFVYMLETQRGTIYTGITTDVQRRYREHLEGLHKKGAKGAKYTNANKPVRLLYIKEYETKSEALKEEYRIKQLRREQKLLMIEETGPIAQPEV